eukprot:216584-Amorphochlora_amoeboformis.AAC.3
MMLLDSFGCWITLGCLCDSAVRDADIRTELGRLHREGEGYAQKGFLVCSVAVMLAGVMLAGVIYGVLCLMMTRVAHRQGIVIERLWCQLVVMTRVVRRQAVVIERKGLDAYHAQNSGLSRVGLGLGLELG